eukprot:TRINITY_DN55730_c0_g1_i1.p1 TRINITY_DN55730_c0_g1~~TRINITY_DN55730_c0_g1_i1.p1  ORF type:complete len:809 (+),score=96.46 TRINITY_DN55730_c0_g1_i1:148-2574(+)
MIAVVAAISLFVALDDASATSLPASAVAEVSAGGFRFRVQALSETLLRVERPSPNGAWEDRRTFLVHGRDWIGADLADTHDTARKTVTLSTKRCEVSFSWDSSVGSGSGDVRITVASPPGRIVWSGGADLIDAPAAPRVPVPSRLPDVWALRDAPRFVPPSWGPTPPPKSGSFPFPETSGFDVSSGAPDVYFFFPTSTGYVDFRRDLLQLTGSVPVLPDFAFGTWFMWYHNYTSASKEQEVEEFVKRGFPLDVAGLDMDWREHPCGRNRAPHCDQYTHDDEAHYIVDKDLLPDLSSLTRWLHERNISLVFNDHPMQVDPSYKAMSPKEIAFRWDGLTSIMQQGLDFWWFDCHWSSTLDGIDCFEHRAENPDNRTGFHCVQTGSGVDFVAWEKYVQFEIMERFNRERRPAGTRTMQLGCSNSNHLADHRYPVWWTGDNNFLQLSQAVADMVDAGLQLKPYVHPDCGGHSGDLGPPEYEYPGEVYTRWAQFCAFGTIFRMHSSPNIGRQPWKYGFVAENITRAFLHMRMAMQPMLVAAGRRASSDGTPVVRRLDLEFPEFAEAAASDQYLLGDDLLVAPIDPWAADAKAPNFNRKRTVWLPPGSWNDAWTGLLYRGPSKLEVSSPVEQMPIFHRRPGVLICGNSSAPNTRAQDWGQLVVEAFPAEKGGLSAERFLYDHARKGAGGKDFSPHTAVSVHSGSDDDRVVVRIDCRHEDPQSCEREWIVRVHLRREQQVLAVRASGAAVGHTSRVLKPTLAAAGVRAMAALRGVSGTLPPELAGDVVEVFFPRAATARQQQVEVETSEGVGHVV